MRLICPNCDAEYEVDDDAIPVSGRDVQCSNCGHSWFQTRPADAPVAALTGEDAPDDAPPDNPVDQDGPAEDEAEETVTAAALRAADVVPPSARLDPGALAMLKEEAAREIAARRAVPPPTEEVQTDLPLAEPAPPPRSSAPEGSAALPEVDPIAAAIAATMAASQVPAADPVPSAPTIAAAVAPRNLPVDMPPPVEPARTRRDRLPDIEEINSTLRPHAFPPGYGPNAAPLPPMPTRSGGRGNFRTGFLLVVTLAIVAMVVYLLAPQLGSAVPALKGPLDSYVAVVDQGRVGLDGLLRGIIDRLRGLAGTAS
jgi:predicted Zn finger-like uncharacterized protein